jgi:uncharacterized membrane protein
MSTQPIAIIVVLIAAFFGAIGQYFFKVGADKMKISWNPLKTINRYLLIAIFLYVSATVVSIMVLPLGELSVLYPLVASNFVWVVLIAKYKLKEKINLFKILGVIAILCGIVLSVV